MKSFPKPDPRATKLTNQVYSKMTSEKYINREPLMAFRISSDAGKVWVMRALCGKCVSELDSSTLKQEQGAAGARCCDFCGRRNSI